MLLSQIENLFNQIISIEQFLNEIQSELNNYEKGLKKKGSSNPIFLNEDISILIVNQQNINFLCNLFLQHKVDKFGLNYVSEALLLSERVTFTNDKIKDALLALTDSEFDNLINPEFIRGVLKDLNSFTSDTN